MLLLRVVVCRRSCRGSTGRTSYEVALVLARKAISR